MTVKDNQLTYKTIMHSFFYSTVSNVFVPQRFYNNAQKVEQMKTIKKIIFLLKRMVFIVCVFCYLTLQTMYKQTVLRNVFFIIIKVFTSIYGFVCDDDGLITIMNNHRK